VSKSILVTGGAGFIGSHLVEGLLAEGGWQITVVDDFNDFYSPAIKRAAVQPYLVVPNYTLVEADIRDESAMAEVLRKTNSTASCTSLPGGCPAVVERA
jgi:UDP-glucuronate 4-epimerase